VDRLPARSRRSRCQLLTQLATGRFQAHTRPCEAPRRAVVAAQESPRAATQTCDDSGKDPRNSSARASRCSVARGRRIGVQVCAVPVIGLKAGGLGRCSCVESGRTRTALRPPARAPEPAERTPFLVLLEPGMARRATHAANPDHVEHRRIKAHRRAGGSGRRRRASRWSGLSARDVGNGALLPSATRKTSKTTPNASKGV